MPTIEQIDRVVDTTSTGIEITRKFHVKPYSLHQNVLEGLRGRVANDGTRLIPANDPWVTNCFCDKAVATMIDPRAMESSDSIFDQAGVRQTLAKKVEPRTGAFITAHYRPLITAWTDTKTPDRRFDWLDPTFTPGVRQLPWPDGLFVEMPDAGGTLRTDNVPDGVKSPLIIPLHDISIKRILVAEVPWVTIGVAADSINDAVFAPNGTRGGGLPSFPTHTLKFVNATVQNMIDSRGNRWFEITNNFQWINKWTQDLVRQGNKIPGWVTWNDIFVSPSYFGYPGPTGFYDVHVGKQRVIGGFRMPAQFPGANAIGGNIHNAMDFEDLFR